ncbi:imelysin family protein [Ideonella livida]|uniref:Imelysin family protein n=1 Tax=Ideonella livida TaxID=2707176 RepID=A0A7C9PH57_9BURK|nr:imelysin family protein [Ideonella livida]NDY91569.1 imelysin family protein [Ideonella livida]
MRSLLPGLLGAVLLCAGLSARAQTDWRREAVPVIPPDQYVHMLDRHAFAPWSADFLARAEALRQRLAVDCAADATAREAWRQALQAWSRLSAAAVGPVVERRSARRIDFQPTRPELLQQALEAAAAGTLDMDRVGSAARGLPALEWLLWSPQAQTSPQTSAQAAGACRLRRVLADDLRAEAQALAEGFAQRQASPPDEDQTPERVAEAVNQWLGGLEQLRLQALERPALSSASGAPALPRALSGASTEDRMARWLALRQLAVAQAAVAPAPGTALVPLETLLRAKGLNPLADRLRAAVAAVDRTLAAVPARAPGPTALRTASRSLAALQRLASEEIAPALQVTIGFSDADGD